MPKRFQLDVSAETDLTPMIGLVLLLIAIFILLSNFGQGNPDDRIKLPSSELARPPSGSSEPSLWLQVTKDAMVLFNGREVPVADMRPLLVREAQVLKRNNKSPATARVIIRADDKTPTGKVQELIQLCQEQQFARFTLRARQETAGR